MQSGAELGIGPFTEEVLSLSCFDGDEGPMGNTL